MIERRQCFTIENLTIVLNARLRRSSFSLSLSSASNCIDDQSERERREEEGKKTLTYSPQLHNDHRSTFLASTLRLFFLTCPCATHTRLRRRTRHPSEHRLHSRIHSKPIMSNIPSAVPSTNGHDSLPLPCARLESSHFGVYEIWQEKTVVGRKNNRREVDVDMGTR